MAKYERSTVLEEDVHLGGGQEWHSDKIEVEEDEIITVTADAVRPFYAGLFTREQYYALGGPGVPEFPFEFGTDRLGYTKRLIAAQPDDFYIVLRVGVFTGKRGAKIKVHLRVEALKPVDD
jgi:hypothetical protein